VGRNVAQAIQGDVRLEQAEAQRTRFERMDVSRRPDTVCKKQRHEPDVGAKV
jgi:hypothetical protein